MNWRTNSCCSSVSGERRPPARQRGKGEGMRSFSNHAGHSSTRRLPPGRRPTCSSTAGMLTILARVKRALNPAETERNAILEERSQQMPAQCRMKHTPLNSCHLQADRQAHLSSASSADMPYSCASRQAPTVPARPRPPQLRSCEAGTQETFTVPLVKEWQVASQRQGAHGLGGAASCRERFSQPSNAIIKALGRQALPSPVLTSAHTKSLPCQAAAPCLPTAAAACRGSEQDQQ